MPVTNIYQVPRIINIATAIPAAPVRTINNTVTVPVINNQLFNVVGEDGDDSWIPGPQGTQGPLGAAGQPGRDGDDGDDSWIPGPAGPQGGQGVPGMQGATGDDGDDSWVPGPAGPQGGQGVPGMQGATGDDGDDSWIPGPMGPQGGQGPMGRDSAWFPEDGDDSWIPGPAGPQGGQGVPGMQGATGDDGDDSWIPGPMGPQGGQGGSNSAPVWSDQYESGDQIEAFPILNDLWNVPWVSYTPTVTPQSGAITAFTINNARYKRSGNTVLFYIDITLTTVGTAGGALLVSLPFSTNAPINGVGREWVTNGSTIFMGAPAGGNTVVNLIYYNSGTIFASGNGTRPVCGAFYEIT